MNRGGQKKIEQNWERRRKIERFIDSFFCVAAIALIVAGVIALGAWMAVRATAAEQEAHRHRQTVADLKRQGFTDSAMQEWTFANDNGKCQQMKHAHFFVEHWEIMRTENIGYLLWGGVGTGKSYFAGCIANALMEQEVAVRMTNFTLILNDLTASFEGRNEYIAHLCRAPLLILDDFGMERGTEHGVEQVYNVCAACAPLMMILCAACSKTTFH